LAPVLLTDALMDSDDEAAEDEFFGPLDHVIEEERRWHDPICCIQRPSSALLAASKFYPMFEAIQHSLPIERQLHFSPILCYLLKQEIMVRRIDPANERLLAFKPKAPVPPFLDYKMQPRPTWVAQTVQEALGSRFFSPERIEEQELPSLADIAAFTRIISHDDVKVEAAEYGAQYRTTQTCKINFPGSEPFFFFIEAIEGFKSRTMRVWFMHTDPENGHKQWLPFPNPFPNPDRKEPEQPQRKRPKKTSATPSPGPGTLVANEFKRHIPNTTNLRNIFYMLHGVATI
jgi:hypothetical protein